MGTLGEISNFWTFYRIFKFPIFFSTRNDYNCHCGNHLSVGAHRCWCLHLYQTQERVSVS